MQGERINLGACRLAVPNGRFLPFQQVANVKRFHLVAGEIDHIITDDVTIRAWGYNGSTPGPVILVHEGDHVQIVLHNHLPERTSIHWHGLIVPNDMDGVPEIGAGRYVDPGSETVYEFIVQQTGTYMYHAHVMDPQQVMMGLVGMFVSLPRHQTVPSREYVMMLQEWVVEDHSLVEGVHTLAPMKMDFNYFTLNGKSYPNTSALRVRTGERIRIRLGNLSMNAHPMHLHGHTFQVVAADGNRLPMPFYKDTINVAPGETWDIEFMADNPGNWAFHCHKPHHISNNHQKKLGGMFTYVKYV